MDRSPQGSMRLHPSIEKSPTPARFRTPDSPTPSPRYQRQHARSLSLEMPMPLHKRTADILRAQSPLAVPPGHRLSSSPQSTSTFSNPSILINQAAAHLANGSHGPLPYSYGSLVSLDPSSMSPIPDRVAIAEIKRVIPNMLLTEGGLDRVAMIEALRADGLQKRKTVTPVTSLFGPVGSPKNSLVFKLTTQGEWAKSLAAGTAGAAFDAVLNDLPGDDDSGAVMGGAENMVNTQNP